MDKTAAHDLAPVTVAGLGPMGAALAAAFVDRGHPTTVWNRSAAKARPLVARGARHAQTLPEAAGASPLLVICVTDYAAAKSIIEGAGDALAGRTVVNLSSSTPEEAREAVGLAAGFGAAYLDGTIMVPVHVIGGPEAVFFYSGSRPVYDAQLETLRALGGDVRFLGDDPGLAVLYNTALLGLMWATANGYLHAAALVGTAGATAADFAPVGLDWLLPSVVIPILHGATKEIDEGVYPGDAGTVRMNLNAADHLLETSRAQGISTHVPRFLKDMLERTVEAGYGDGSYMGMIEVLRRPAEG
ncbi:3-hydroxyisobutyrate dehydrogenase [Streptoalloteichus tenebrarius]|uniref:3-hydroxyisobutyrate dehydrogenase n=1 Tax=Streptoalloteichus tenebrarius (strain ATCC 17920 / DSM 40477 / JCM 4838 / CBS 697.72 / NBRC 16177 / NCIMB 11028 / NRRL B-12390 / A12253. 1 / ISP 5477) TaxID=1933 RepID=A0ABT1HS02_STRSD|nr:NAD(P)-binding domain-containing protein [Streptoalloteichus tenebrarius]MCP2258298.1 3-hydroxyisobutyrate dehydrogenase [Streptoalloteichus tenebrarius]BFF04466.1 NAD(P)-binding domain-containing protein [Streptoalloteichus tenebrarius]